MEFFKYQIFTLFAALSLFVMFSCSDDKSTTPTENTVDIPSVISASKILSSQSLKAIASDTALKNADFALITYLRTDRNMNLHLTAPGLVSGAYAAAKYFDEVTSINLNNQVLTMTSPLVFPGYFYTESNLDADTNYYSKPALWTVNCKNKTNYGLSSYFADSLYRVSIGTKDSIALNRSMTINWTKPYSSVSSSVNSRKIYISLVWYPSFSDADYGKELGGFFSGDTGIYLTAMDYLSSLNIPNYGILQVNVCRYSIKKEYSDKKFVFIDAAETPVCLYIK